MLTLPRSTVILFIVKLSLSILANAQETKASFHPSRQAASIVVGKPFWAEKYSQAASIQTDGTPRLTPRIISARIARDSSGRIRFDRLSTPQDCDPRRDDCTMKYCLIFDPLKGTITHWLEGESADKGATTVTLSESQKEEAIALTSAPPDDIVSDRKNSTVTFLGARAIDGIKTSGYRSYTCISKEGPTGACGRLKFREIWVSENLNATLQVLDGEIPGDYTIVGLQHIATAPESSLFLPPQGRTIYYYKDRHEYADGDLEDLKLWFIK